MKDFLDPPPKKEEKKLIAHIERFSSEYGK